MESPVVIDQRLRAVVGPEAIGQPGRASPMPGTPTGEAWGGFLRAHASLMRVLDTELSKEAGVSLSDFDVLVQLAMADGARLRMSELARRTLISRSGMTRRVGQLEERGLVSRKADLEDRRSVAVTLTEAGVAQLRTAFPVHVRGIDTHFLSRLDDAELAQVRSAMEKVVIDCDFG